MQHKTKLAKKDIASFYPDHQHKCVVAYMIICIQWVQTNRLVSTLSYATYLSSRDGIIVYVLKLEVVLLCFLHDYKI